MNEVEKYETMWSIDEYRIHSPEVNHLSEFRARLRAGDSVNIYGCGPGRAGMALAEAGHGVHMIDIAMNSLDTSVAASMIGRTDISFHRGPIHDAASRMPQADWGYCCDVLEHIPPAAVPASLRAIATLTPRVFMTIAHVADGFGPRYLGEPLHMTVRPPEWWQAIILSIWRDVAGDCSMEWDTQRPVSSTVVMT